MDFKKFALLAGQLALLYAVIWFFRVDEPGRTPQEFHILSACAFIGFVLHYFTPWAWKKWMMVLLSLAGGLAVVVDTSRQTSGALPVFELISASSIGLAIVIGLVIFTLMRLPAPFAVRAGLVVAFGAGLAWWRTIDFLPDGYWLVVAPIFMFRTILYVYEVKAARKPERLDDFASYFFLLPNFYFALFPVIDYSTFKKGWYAEDIHRTAQRGISWMVRGTVQLLLYRLVYHHLTVGVEDVNSPLTLVQFLIVPFWLYLKVSGTFHIIVGMLHLFGYSLPETNRRYYLASSFTDFWRRINIYWKDFMIKTVYYPVYFRLRKKNETLALVVATLAVFFVTTLLHSYQTFWFQGAWVLGLKDLAFWGALGVLVLINVLVETRGGKKASAASLGRRVVQTAGVYLAISILWSLWSAGSPEDWWTAVTYWRQ